MNEMAFSRPFGTGGLVARSYERCDAVQDVLEAEDLTW
jgi:hypothetical protein